ncbi:hypothetical protein TTHERM_00530689 (macronuclear) [Tetrahymena thermophila SB210]|uniref:Uncharacterized protein n=1 Tax=Tetrahymena thermophila (strain SB210) TaxID=312017 RepID=X1W3V7_TETTS|nr:hypothetical protein TTHERM_00530689 [Tetrahymena thermophila SB210]EDK31228.2 hypothetical protein TTHERM_00530689 [Tetrahymena thermophila SB210]|eukprot:XP_001470666.2 hypothetical protein TTHERM_00530689 [Tetrahymena thermophila SB210]
MKILNVIKNLLYQKKISIRPYYLRIRYYESTIQLVYFSKECIFAGFLCRLMGSISLNLLLSFIICSSIPSSTFKSNLFHNFAYLAWRIGFLDYCTYNFKINQFDVSINKIYLIHHSQRRLRTFEYWKCLQSYEKHNQSVLLNRYNHLQRMRQFHLFAQRSTQHKPQKVVFLPCQESQFDQYLLLIRLIEKQRSKSHYFIHYGKILLCKHQTLHIFLELEFTLFKVLLIYQNQILLSDQAQQSQSQKLRLKGRDFY